MSWNAPLGRSASYTPAGSANSAAHTHSRTQALSSPGGSRRHSALHHPTRWPQTLFFQLSPSLPSPGCSPSKAGCPGSLPTPQLSTSAALTAASLPLSFHPAHLGHRTWGAAGAVPTRWRCRVRSHTPPHHPTPCQPAPRHTPIPTPELALLPKLLSGPLLPDSSPSLLQERPNSSCPPLPLLPAGDLTCCFTGDGGGPQRRTPQLSAASSSSGTPLHSLLLAGLRGSCGPPCGEPSSIWTPKPLSPRIFSLLLPWFPLLPNHFLSAVSIGLDV